ncbi:MAG: protein kinase [bacterium]
MIGKTISHYKILEKLGEGGMGVVYKAEDTKLKRTVALKFLPPQALGGEEEKSRFVHEAQAAATLLHPNVATIFDFEEVGGQSFIVMEFVEGQSLKEKIEDNLPKVLNLRKVLDIAIQVAEGLREAHEKGIVHRDIKSANIMVTKKEQAKILDFGLAKLTGRTKLTMTGMTMGTTAYMSPEQLRGETVDHRTDIWSLGVLIYEMVTGQLPFQGDYEQAVTYSILNEEPEPITGLRTGVPSELERIVNKTLAKSPDERYQRIQDILIDLRKLKKEYETGILKERPSTMESVPSIAVLPFADMSPQRDQEYFCEGIVEELINALTQIGRLQVAARTSAFQFKGKGYDIHEIGKKLKVQTVLEGSVRKAGNRLRVTAQLVDVQKGYHLWSEKYDRDMEDIFAIQDEISLAIVEKLKVQLMGDEKKALVKRYTDNLEAYNTYLKGRYFWNKRYKDAVPRAIEHFEKAIDIDPAYALAYSGLADCYIMLGAWHFLPLHEAFSIAKSAAEKVLELDKNLAEGYTSIGLVKWLYDWNWHDTENAFKRAIELNPNYALAHCYYGHFLAAMGRSSEAIAEATKAYELEPLSLVINSNNGLTYYLSRQYDRAILAFQNALDIDPNSVVSLLWIAWTYVQESMTTEAIAVLQKAVTLVEGSTIWLANLGMVYAAANKRSEAQTILKELRIKAKKQHVAAIQLVWIYIGLGDVKQAFKWLDKAYEEHNIQLYLLKTDPTFDILRPDPRFSKLLKKMDLEK